MICERCGTELEIGMYPFCKGTAAGHGSPTMSFKSNIFPFTTSHVTGKPIEITDIGHLRRLEKTYGVAFSAFNKDNVRDLDPLKDIPTYRENGRDYEG